MQTLFDSLKKILPATIASGFIIAAAYADSMRSECGFSPSPHERPATTSPCVFSQRQGFISVSIDDGAEFEFSPVGERPGNYLDQQDNAIYRVRGLGSAGQLFKLPESYLYVFWKPSRLDCTGQELSKPNMCTLSYGALSFDLAASADSSLNQLQITPAGLTGGNNPLNAELDGTAYGAELADLDSNGWPEIYVYVSSAGSGSYGSLVAFAVNNGKSATPIYLPPLEQSPQVLEGYMGHDQFAVVETRLVRRFPIYLEGDTNAAPTGKTRQLQYRLETGEAGWVLVLDKVVEY